MMGLGALLAVPLQSQGCNNDADCSFLGVCTSGQCACNKGWTGSDCAKANLLPYPATGDLGYVNATTASWGGHPVQDPHTANRWHLFAAEIAEGCPLWLFENNSQIIRAVSDTGPGGPYKKMDTIFPPFRHSPQVTGPTPDGYYIMFHNGAQAAGQTVIDCKNHGIPKNYKHPDPHSQMVISLAWAKSPEGPWAERQLFVPDMSKKSAWTCHKTNPSPFVNSDGSIVLAFRSNPCEGPGGEHIGIATANHWNATTYNVMTEPVVSPKSGTGNHEDPFLWRDALGRWHIVTHNQSKGNVCKAGIQSCGAHLYSADLSQWRVSRTPVYDKVSIGNDTAFTMATRQRPQLIFDSKMNPTFLFNGGAFHGEGNRDLKHLTHTYAFRFQE